MEEGDDGLGSHSAAQCQHVNEAADKNALCHTFSPVSPDELLQSIDADNEGIKGAICSLGVNAPLGQVFLVNLVRMPRSRRCEEQVDYNDRSGVICSVHGHPRCWLVGRRANSLDNVLP